MDVSKTKSSFYRRLYVAYLIDSQLASSVPALTEATGMPRRTAQDTIAALADLDIVCVSSSRRTVRVTMPGAIGFGTGGRLIGGGSRLIWRRSSRCWAIPEGRLRQD